MLVHFPDVPGYRPKYTNEDGTAKLTLPKRGEQFVSLNKTAIGDILSGDALELASHNYSHAWRVVMEEDKTYAEKLREWWPRLIIAKYMAVNKSGTLVMSNSPLFANANGEWCSECGDIHMVCQQEKRDIPPLEGDWRDSLVENPHQS